MTTSDTQEAGKGMKIGPITTHKIGYDEATEVAQRLIAGAFNRTDKRPRFSIPCRPEHDDDCIIIGFIEQQAEENARLLQENKAMREALTPGADEAFDALDLADNLIGRAYGTDVPVEWNRAIKKVARARTILTQGEGK